MRIDIVNNAKRNIKYGFMNRIASVVCPFLNRTMVQYLFGEQYLGLSGLFQSILSVLSLAELGFGSAVVYSMYKPAADGDIKLINALLFFYKKVYKYIGCIILLIGLMLLPFLPRLINGTYPEEINIVILYMIYLCNTVLSYFMFAHMSSLIVVYQRDDLYSKTNMVMTILLTVSQIFVLLNFKNYYCFAILIPVFTIINNIKIAVVVRKMFPQYHCGGTVPPSLLSEMKKQVIGTFIGKGSAVARNSFDSIFLSAFLGLGIAVKYSNYYYIMNAVGAFLVIFQTALLGGVGNHTVTKTNKENLEEFRKIDFIYMMVSGWCSVCLLCICQPFMKIWMGQRMMFPDIVLVLFCIYFYLLRVGDMRTLYSSANGLWWQNRWRAIAEMIANIVLNFILGKLFGVYGIISATIITLIIFQTFWGGYIVFDNYFGKEYFRPYLLTHAKYAYTTIIISLITYSSTKLFSFRNMWVELFATLCICLIVPALLFFGLYRKNEYLIVVKNKLTGIVLKR